MLAVAGQRNLRRTAVAAIVVLGHLALFRVLTPGAPSPRKLTAVPPLEVMIFPRARPKPTPSRRPRRFSRARRPGRRRGFIARPSPEPITLPAAAASPHRARIRWRSEIRREARAQELRSEAPAPHLTFGFPAMAPRDRPPRAFGWDYARTHRIEMLRGEGILINITDRCSVLFAGVLIPFCRIGRIPANGRLFRHLRDPTRDRLGVLP